MSAPKHTPEPWSLRQLEQGRERAPYIDIYVADQQSEHYGSVASVSAGMSGKARANAARMVACVNACTGMCDPAIEVQALQARAIEAIEKGNRIMRLEAELEFLVAELGHIANAKPSEWPEEMRDEFQPWAQSRARFALAKIAAG